MSGTPYDSVVAVIALLIVLVTFWSIAWLAQRYELRQLLLLTPLLAVILVLEYAYLVHDWYPFWEYMLSNGLKTLWGESAVSALGIGLSPGQLPVEGLSAHTLHKIFSLPKSSLEKPCKWRLPGARARPGPVVVDAVASLWMQHPCMATGTGSHPQCGMTSSAAGRASLYPRIHEASAANHRAVADLMGVPYVQGGGLEFHGLRSPSGGMHALCEKMRFVRQPLDSHVAEGHWLLFADADAAFKCSPLCLPAKRPPSKSPGSLGAPSNTSGHASEKELLRRHGAPRLLNHTRCAGANPWLNELVEAAWDARRADVSFMIWSAFGGFAVRNDAWTRALFADWTSVLATRPLLCMLSNVPDVAGFHLVYGPMTSRSYEERRCSTLYVPELERGGSLHTMHIAGQDEKRDHTRVEAWIHALQRETQCVRTLGVGTPGERHSSSAGPRAGPRAR